MFSRNSNQKDKFHSECNLCKLNTCQCHKEVCDKNDSLFNIPESKESPSTTSYITSKPLGSLNDSESSKNVQIANVNEQLCLTDNVAQNNSSSFYNERKGLHVACLNSQHIMPKIDEIKLHLCDDNSTNILGLTETFLSDEIDDKELTINCFDTEKKIENIKRVTEF